MNLSDRCNTRVVLLCIAMLSALLFLTLCAEGAEAASTQSQWVRVTVKTDTTINSGVGYYLGGGIVTAEQSLARGSVNMRAKVTFPCGKIYHGTIIFQDRRPDLCFIKLDNMPDLAGRYRQRGRTKRFFRLASYTPEQLEIIADLPPGATPTQRALIYAVRTHPDRPASTNGTFNPMLAKEAESHSLHQARIRLQGHHNWDARFHRINAKLPGLTVSEVCAESWPGESLVEAATECVNSWRQSPGHWRAVSGECPVYAYDMKRGRNGVWYATGLFGQN